MPRALAIDLNSAMFEYHYYADKVWTCGHKFEGNVQILQAQFLITEVTSTLREKILETSGNVTLRKRRRTFDVA